MLITQLFFCAFQTNQKHKPHYFLCGPWMIAFQERCREQLMFSSAIGWITFMLYYLATESSNTESFDIKMPQIITLTMYYNSETSSLLSICSILVCILLSVTQMAHSPNKVQYSSTESDHVLYGVPHAQPWANPPHTWSQCWWTTVLTQPILVVNTSNHSDCITVCLHSRPTPPLIKNFPCSNHQ